MKENFPKIFRQLRIWGGGAIASPCHLATTPLNNTTANNNRHISVAALDEVVVVDKFRL